MTEEQIMDGLPPDCQKDISSKRAEIKIKNGTFLIVDFEDSTLIDVLPLVYIRGVYYIAVQGKAGKTYKTHLGEILCRRKGKVSYYNRLLYDYRKKNLIIKDWEDCALREPSMRGFIDNHL